MCALNHMNFVSLCHLNNDKIIIIIIIMGSQAIEGDTHRAWVSSHP